MLACLGWTAAAGALELLSIAGFVVVFFLVFCGRMSWRRVLWTGLRTLAASILLPVGPGDLVAERSIGAAPRQRGRSDGWTLRIR